MDSLLDSLLALATESEVVEFKEAKTQQDKDKLGQYFSALSNEANLSNQAHAWFVMGVRNDRSIVGTTINEILLNELKKELAQHTSPRLSFEATHRIKRDGKMVIVCKIPPAPSGQPVAWKGHYYGRDGESLGALNQREYDIIRLQNRAHDWSIQMIPDASFDDLSKEAIDFARIQYIEKNKQNENEIKGWDDITFLNKAKVTVRGQITRAAILLLGKPESDHWLSPSQAKITWILKDKENVQKDYHHFGCPYILAVSEVNAKIRNLKYRYIKNDSLFPDEVDQYDPFIMRESLNNCIAHQDYTLNGRINIIEREDGLLIFSNLGAFMPESVEHVINSDSPAFLYRNSFLANAMVNLNMIDTTGSGIKRMFQIQRNKYFPMPDYDITNNQVQVTIVGKVLDLNYARKLAAMSTLSLREIILLDKVSKQKFISVVEMKELKTKDLIEGRKPNFHVSATVAGHTGEKASYLRARGIDDDYCKKMIVDFLEKFSEGKREDFEGLLFEKLPSVLDSKQKKNKIRNILQSLRKEQKIYVSYKVWRLV